MPANVYVSGAIGASILSIKNNNKTNETDSGFGINLLVGKEWWVSQDWGVGVAAQLMFSRVSDKSENSSTKTDFDTVSGGVLLTGTYN